MEIKCLKEFDLGMELGQVRSVPVSLGKDMPEAVLFVYSSQGNLDPWPELFNYPKDTLKWCCIPWTESGCGRGIWETA